MGKVKWGDVVVEDDKDARDFRLTDKNGRKIDDNIGMIARREGYKPNNSPKYDPDDPARALDWYSYGPMPKERPGLVAMLHPQTHKRFWEASKGKGGISDWAPDLARALKRHVWVVTTESRWLLIMLGDAPGPESDSPFTSRDQFIGYYDPRGEWNLVGLS